MVHCAPAKRPRRKGKARSAKALLHVLPRTEMLLYTPPRHALAFRIRCGDQTIYSLSTVISATRLGKSLTLDASPLDKLPAELRNFIYELAFT